MEANDLRIKNLDELKTLAKESKIKGFSKMKKNELIDALSHISQIEDELTQCVDQSACHSGVCPIVPPVTPVSAPIPISTNAPKKRERKHKSPVDTIDVDETLKKVSKSHLQEFAQKHGVENVEKMTKASLIDSLIEKTVSDLLKEITSSQ